MRYVLSMLVVSLLVFLAACSTASEDRTAADEPTPTPDVTATPTGPIELSWEDVVELLEPSTVMVRADFPETAVSWEGQGSGTGIVYSEDGYILTNAHVVSGAAALTVSTSGSPRQRSARFVGVSACDDLAVLQVTDMDGLEPATLGDSSDFRVGAEVATLGYPLGDMLGLDISFARGVIGQMNDTQGHYERLIQHDAAVNPGNSGGPLVTRTGEVIGINSLFIDPAFGQSMYWAIDINQTKPIVSELEGGNNRLWIGMNLAPNDYPDYFGTDEGLVVAAVGSGSSASAIGVEPAYLLTHLEGLTVNSMDDVCRVLRSQNEGDSVSVEFMHITETEVQWLAGEVVIGGSGGADLEIVLSESFETPGNDDTDVALTPAADDDELELADLFGSWSGIATVEFDYWAPCGEGGDWIHYDSMSWTHDVRMDFGQPYDRESNPYWFEIYTEERVDGGIWMTSAWEYEDGELGEFWALDYEPTLEFAGIDVFGMLVEPYVGIYPSDNIVHAIVPIDPCFSDDVEFLDLDIETGAELVGNFSRDSARIEISGMTADLSLDFRIVVVVSR